MDFYAHMSAWSEFATAIATSLLVITGGGALLFAYVQISRERSYRQVENLQRELSKFDGSEFAEARRTLACGRLQKFGLLSSENAPAGAYRILNYFEYLALLAKRRHLDIRDVWHTFGWWILMLAHDLRPLVNEEREASKSVYCDFEWLAREVGRIEEKEEGKALVVTSDALKAFYEEEAEVFESSKPTITRRPKKPGRGTKP